jgi:Kdo2-lipid IVA lauroyltransferase/acyltransferase
MRSKLEYLTFVGIGFFLRLLGIKNARRFSIGIALFFFYLLPIRKKTTIENLKLAFPTYSGNQINKAAFNAYKSFAITLTEILILPFLSKKIIESQVSYENLDLLLKKHKEGRGVILLSAHYGNWEIGALALGSATGIPLSVIYQPLRNPYVTNFINKMRTRWNNKAVQLGVSLREIYSTLNEKNIVAIVADQRGKPDGLKVNFFNRETAVRNGYAALSEKLKIPILMGLVTRQKDYTYKIELTELNMENFSSDAKMREKELVQRYFNFLEANIKDDPGQWLWMHKIWKY